MQNASLSHSYSDLKELESPHKASGTTLDRPESPQDHLRRVGSETALEKLCVANEDEATETKKPLALPAGAAPMVDIDFILGDFSPAAASPSLGPQSGAKRRKKTPAGAQNAVQDFLTSSGARWNDLVPLGVVASAETCSAAAKFLGFDSGETMRASLVAVPWAELARVDGSAH